MFAHADSRIAATAVGKMFAHLVWQNSEFTKAYCKKLLELLSQEEFNKMRKYFRAIKLLLDLDDMYQLDRVTLLE